MTKKELLDAIHGQMIISCQAVEGEPLYVEEKSIMYLMARAAKQAGTPAIRTSSIRDVIAIKEETGLPVIGLVKIQYPGYEGYITPTMKDRKTTLANGTIAGSATCLFGCMKSVISMGVPEREAILAATANPARSIGIYDEVGSLTPGKRADIVLTDEELNIVKVL